MKHPAIIGRRVSVVAAALGLAACATNPVPEGYTGPVSYIYDTAETESSSRGRLYYLSSVDGSTVVSALTKTRQASQNRGFNVITVGHGRPVPARKMKLNVVATHVTGAPIHEISARAAGTFFSVEGEVEFAPDPSKTYVVKGELSKERSCVWLQETVTHEAVPPKICKP